ncbi:uncharacterized protein [Blastocystis hominis]|uniref:ABC transporter n=1 Tax=Blastocystis hominis TaxID=12968 RepID=D8M379_BLAHO|nr:uncharacterized protein [Blastocystis hominis]CBK22352.2 unnamed protein product [Blastocystis hominis]|eukprot:XP_012896400.1 uncharacterized protein [Blastocystis hominis]
MTGFLIPISYIFLGDIVNKNNLDGVSLSEVMNVLYVFVGNLLVATTFAFFERWCLNGYAENLTRHLREKYIYALLHHDVDYIESEKPGALGQTVAEESSRIINGLGPSIGQFVRAIATFLCGLLIGFTHSWELTLLTLIAAPLVTLAGFRFASAMGKWIETLMRDHKEADSIAEESIRNYKTVTALGAEASMEKKYRKGFPQELYDAGCVTDLISSVDVCFSNATLSDNCMAICDRVSSCWYQSGNGQCLVGGDLLIVLCGVMNSFLGLGPAFSAIQAIKKTCASATSFVKVIEHEDAMKSGSTTPSSSKGDVVYKNVDFKYASRDTQVLKQLNFTIRENEMIGIVGESGSGKSTILKLLMRLYAPTAGTITWDGVDVTTLSTAWIRDQISYVAQEPVLFSGTIRENLLYGREGCTEEEMVEAAKLVEADAFIRSFPKGYDTFVGELGSSLSGGQKQRIAIARALIRNPRILVLDEATSALDSQSEKIVQNAMETIRRKNEAKGKGLSIVIVAHRLSSIRSCDRIVVVEEGKIVEEGDHESLLAKGGIYAGLYKSQETLEKEEEEGAEGTEKKEEKEADAEAKKKEERNEKEKEKEAETADSKNKNKKKDENEKAEKPKKYNLFSLYNYFGRTKCILWIAFIGVLCTAMYPAGYAIVVALMHAIPFRLDVSTIWREGIFFSTMMVVVTVIYASGDLLWWDLSSVVKENMIVTVRSKSFVKLLSQSVAYYDEKEHSPAAVTSELSIDVRKLRDFMDEVGSFFESFIIAILCLIITFSGLGSWELSCISLLACPLLFTAEYCQNKLVANVTEKIDSNLTAKSGEITDSLLNIHTIHSYNLQDRVYESMIHDLERTNRLCTSRSLRSAIANILAILCPMTYMVITFTAGTILISYNVIEFQQMMIVYNTVFLMATYIGITMGKIPNMALAQEAARRVFSLIESSGEKDALRALPGKAKDGAIAFDHVSFAYPTRPDAPILSDVSFSIPKGSSVAFVGPSGCGKSTIISLIQRMYKPEKCQLGLVSFAAGRGEPRAVHVQRHDSREFGDGIGS